MISSEEGERAVEERNWHKNETLAKMEFNVGKLCEKIWTLIPGGKLYSAS